MFHTYDVCVVLGAFGNMWQCLGVMGAKLWSGQACKVPFLGVLGNHSQCLCQVDTGA